MLQHMRVRGHELCGCKPHTEVESHHSFTPSLQNLVLLPPLASSCVNIPVDPEADFVICPMVAVIYHSGIKEAVCLCLVFFVSVVGVGCVGVFAMADFCSQIGVCVTST